MSFRGRAGMMVRGGAVCFIREQLGPRAGPCDGPLQRMHLVKKSWLRVELRPVADGTYLDDIVWRPGLWRPGCEKHHYALDYSRKVRLRREHIPVETEEEVERLDAMLLAAGRHPSVGAWLEREYGVREAVG